MDQVVVRHAEQDDAPALHQLYSQQETLADTLQLPLPSLKRWQERLNALPDGQFQLVACVGGHVAGQCTVTINSAARRRHSASFGLGVDTRYRQRGVGKAMMAAIVDLCDNWLQVSRIELTVYADNQAAIALYEKFGFIVEGRAARFAMRSGEMVDALFMARLKG